ncbi:MAG: radical SAM protein [Bacteroidales bacterium]
MVKKQLEDILSLCTLFFDGREIPVSGFRLKLKYWCTSPTTTLLENLGSPTSLCNSQCKFCYIKGSPFWHPHMLSLSEAKTRVKYFACKTKKGLFLTSYEYGEPFLNPNFLKILKLVREKSPDEVLYPIITNGSLLTEPMIKSLAQVKPIILDISLNAVTPRIRKKFMGRQNHEITINSTKILKRYGIPFRGTIIAWPGLSHNEIEKTIKYLDTYEPQLIAIYPPGYTKYHQSSCTVSDMNKHWQELVAFYLKIRRRIKSPLLFSPNSFWNKDLKAIIDGVIKNSPAEKAGIKMGDTIYAINGDRIFSRESARSKLQLLTQKVVK